VHAQTNIFVPLTIKNAEIKVKNSAKAWKKQHLLFVTVLFFEVV